MIKQDEESAPLTVTAASTPPAMPPDTREAHCGVICWGLSQNQNTVDHKWRRRTNESTFRGSILLLLGWTESLAAIMNSELQPNSLE